MAKKIAENFNRLSRAHKRYWRQTTDRRSFTSSSRTAFVTIARTSDRFFWATWFLFLVFPHLFVSVPCARLRWSYRQLLSVRKKTFSRENWCLAGKDRQRSRRGRVLSSILAASKQEINSARAPNVMPAMQPPQLHLTIDSVTGRQQQHWRDLVI